MSNEYKQGVDRVAVDESFPYPIKLEYDDEHIYLTVLKLPSDPWELKANPFAMRWSGSDEQIGGHTYQSFYSHLILCVEVKACGNHSKDRCMMRKDKRKDGYPSGRRATFIRREASGFVVNPVVGRKYSFAISDCLQPIQVRILEYDDCWLIARGAFRYGANSRGGGYGPIAGGYGNNYHFAGRTGYVSNVAKVPCLQSVLG